MKTLPLATYRLQFHKDFPFEDARAILPYLEQLGVSTVYASPIFKAVSGSMHGYDVTDPNALNPELGDDEEFAALMGEKERLELGWLQDIVPNHMAFSSANAMLMDVLKQREKSPFFQFFDIDWHDPDPALNGKVLVPVLGDNLEKVLKDEAIQVAVHNEQMMLCYYDHRLPLNGHSVEWLSSQTHQTDTLDDFHKGSDGVSRMKALLAQQYYVLDCWKNAKDRINYRRFFYINQLISMRVEDAEVMDATHRLIVDQVQRRNFTGLRIDHIDGLYDPTRYLERLRKICPKAYIVAEKILEFDEPLCDHWPIEGTTGYDFCAQVNALFCDHRRRAAFLEGYQAFIDETIDYDRMLFDQKCLILDAYMKVELDRLTNSVCALLDAENEKQDVCAALRAIIAAFGTYRTYFDGQEFRDVDRRVIRDAIDSAKKYETTLHRYIDAIGKILKVTISDLDKNNAAIVDFIRRFEQLTGPVMAKGFEDTLLYQYNLLVSQNEVGGFPHQFGIDTEDFHTFIKKRQHRWPHTMNATATHDTKRGEDLRTRLNVLSEIPDEWFRKTTAWSRLNEPLKRSHNGKRIPDRNDEYLIYQTLVGAMPFGAVREEDFEKRVKAYIVKALRESKRNTRWISPDSKYETAAEEFIDGLTADTGSAFWQDFVSFQRKIAHCGLLNSLSQTLLKLTVPGVCDLYQGSELWDLSLVDPDNRRPVDYETRSAMLKTIIGRSASDRNGLLKDLIGSPETGQIKLFLIHTLLQQRHLHPKLFAEGDYLPLRVEGQHARHLLAFSRRFRNTIAITVVPRLMMSLVEPNTMPLGRDIWRDTRICLPENVPSTLNNPLTGTTTDSSDSAYAGDLIEAFPVAFLHGRS